MTNQLQADTFAGVARLFHRFSGILLVESKQALVYGRLQRMALDHGHSGDVESFARLLLARQVPDHLIVDLMDRLTTNETYFFREPQHFDDLRTRARARRDSPEFRVWSAASSSGEEAYSIAMVLADELGLRSPWAVHGTDISTGMIEAARTGLYAKERARNVPLDYLKKYCLQGHGAHLGQVLMSRDIRARAHFEFANLMRPLPAQLPLFDVIFLRNVLIYFDAASKAEIVARVAERLKPEGVLYTGHAESLTGLDLPLRTVGIAVYQRS